VALLRCDNDDDDLPVHMQLGAQLTSLRCDDDDDDDGDLPVHMQLGTQLRHSGVMMMMMMMMMIMITIYVFTRSSVLSRRHSGVIMMMMMVIHLFTCSSDVTQVMMMMMMMMMSPAIDPSLGRLTSPICREDCAAAALLSGLLADK